MARKLLMIACVAVVLLTAVNFITFIVQSERLGGDALNGHHSDGHFYVSAHGHTTEVEEGVWRQSRRRALSVFASFPLAMAAMAYLIIRFILPRYLYRGDRNLISATERRVRGRGLPLCRTRCGGRIGQVNLSTPLLRVEVYREGLWIKPAGMTPFAIPVSEIESLTEKQGWMSKRIEVAHGSTQVASPVFLFCSGHPQMVADLKSIVRERARAVPPDPRRPRRP